MDKESFERLIADKPKDIKTKAALLFNGAATGASAYHTSPTASNLRDWEAAEAALAKFTASLGAPPEGENVVLANLADVLDYLVSAGWKSTKTSLHRHHREGKIIPREDGTYPIKDVNKYARTFLKQVSTGRRLTEQLDNLQRQKLEMELKNLTLENRRKERIDEKEQANLIPREQAVNELCVQFAILEADLMHLIMSSVAEWIRLVSGDVRKAGDLINKISHDVEVSFTTYARAKDYEAHIDPAEEEDEPEL